MSAGLVELTVLVDVRHADLQVVQQAMAESRRARARLDAFDIDAAARLDELARESPSMVPFPERAVAEATRVSLVEASKQFDRARTVDTVPELAAVLAAGDTSAAHVDVVSRALRDLDADDRQRLAARGDVLALAASSLPRDEFAKTVRREIRRLCADDGLSRLERQKRATRLRTGSIVTAGCGACTANTTRKPG